MVSNDGRIRFMDIAIKAAKVAHSARNIKQIRVARSYINLACFEMSNTEYYQSGGGDVMYAKTAHLFAVLDGFERYLGGWERI